jgi:hypothetical protein
MKIHEMKNLTHGHNQGGKGTAQSSEIQLNPYIKRVRKHRKTEKIVFVLYGIKNLCYL